MKTNLTPSPALTAHLRPVTSCAAGDVPTEVPNGIDVAIVARRSRENAHNRQPEVDGRVEARQEAVQPALDPNTTYRCKNCGKRIKLRDAVSYYGVPACPVCVRAYAPFEIEPDTADSSQAGEYPIIPINF